MRIKQTTVAITTKKVGDELAYYICLSKEGRAYKSTGICTKKLTTKDKEKINKLVAKFTKLCNDNPANNADEIMAMYEERNSLTISQAISKLAKERNWAENTILSYSSLLKLFGDVPLSSINPEEAVNLVDKYKNNSKVLYLSRLRTLLTICDTPFTNPYSLKSSQSANSITLDELKTLKNVFNSMSINHKDYKPLSIILLIWECQGLSPRDLYLLDKSSFQQTVINGIPYYIIHTKRSKTGKPVTITLEINDYTNRLLATNIKVNSYNIRRVSTALSKRCSNCLEKYLGRHLTLYSIRRGFATISVNRGIPLFTVASMMGRSVNGLECYLSAPISTIISSKITL